MTVVWLKASERTVFGSSVHWAGKRNVDENTCTHFNRLSSVFNFLGHLLDRKDPFSTHVDKPIQIFNLKHLYVPVPQFRNIS